MAGFITELKLAVTMVFVATPVAPFAGNVAITMGYAGLGACARPHPAARATRTIAAHDIFPILNLHISCFYLSGDKRCPQHQRQSNVWYLHALVFSVRLWRLAVWLRNRCHGHKSEGYAEYELRLCSPSSHFSRKYHSIEGRRFRLVRDHAIPAPQQT